MTTVIKEAKKLEERLFNAIKEYMIFWGIPEDWDALDHDANCSRLCVDVHIEQIKEEVEKYY